MSTPNQPPASAPAEGARHRSQFTEYRKLVMKSQTFDRLLSFLRGNNRAIDTIENINPNFVEDHIKNERLYCERLSNGTALVSIHHYGEALGRHATLQAENEALSLRIAEIRASLRRKDKSLPTAQEVCDRIANLHTENEALRKRLEWVDGTATNLLCALQSTACMDPRDRRIATVTGQVIRDLAALVEYARSDITTAKQGGANA